MSHARVSVQIATSLFDYDGDARVRISHYLRLVLVAVLRGMHNLFILIVGYVFVIVDHLNIWSCHQTASFGFRKLTLAAHNNALRERPFDRFSRVLVIRDLARTFVHARRINTRRACLLDGIVAFHLIIKSKGTRTKF